MEPTLHVKLAAHHYPITIGDDLRSTLLQMLQQLRDQGRPVAVIADAGLLHRQADYARTVFGDLPRLELPSGESSKSFLQLERICDFLADIPLDRSGVLVAFGGGVVGDCAGFAAAAYLRGIELWMVPSTLLSMVDSSVGGKTGINLKAGKNLVGAFHQPHGVWIDTSLLHSLPDREFRAGMAEVIKYGLLGDADFFQRLETESVLHPGHAALPAIIRHCCAMKAAVVESDERETATGNGRALLNLGHTFAHAIEACAGYGAYLHGEAVAIGLVLAARLAAKLGQIRESESNRVANLLQRYQLPTTLREPLPIEDLMHAMRRDKKVRRGKLRLVLLDELGKATTTDDVPENEIREIWVTAQPGI